MFYRMFDLSAGIPGLGDVSLETFVLANHDAEVESIPIDIITLFCCLMGT